MLFCQKWHLMGKEPKGVHVRLSVGLLGGLNKGHRLLISFQVSKRDLCEKAEAMNRLPLAKLRGPTNQTFRTTTTTITISL